MDILIDNLLGDASLAAAANEKPRRRPRKPNEPNISTLIDTDSGSKRTNLFGRRLGRRARALRNQRSR